MPRQRREEMSQVCRIGLDIAKNVFQAYGEDEHGKKIFNKKISRNNLLEFFANLPPCLVGIEACGGAHYWAREIQKLGHDVRLVSPRLVKPFVINSKTDAADANAICEVVKRPSTKFVRIKTIDQQQIASLHRIRERIVVNRTALANQIRGLLYEIGIILSQGIKLLRKDIPFFLENENEKITPFFKSILQELWDEFLDMDARIEGIEKKLNQLVKTDDSCMRLMKIPGVGVMTATAIVAHMGDGKQFKNGRQFSSCLGLTPREHSSGGKQKLLGISKHGDCYIRKLLIQGARAVHRSWCCVDDQTQDRRKLWLRSVSPRRGTFVATVAQANKTARIIWNVLARNVDYQPSSTIAN